MNLKKFAGLMPIVLLINILFYNIGQTQTNRPDESIFLSGPVKEVSWDRKTIVVNERKFHISRDTLVVDQDDNKLKLEDIKQDANVAIDAIRQSGTFVIKKMVIIVNKGL